MSAKADESFVREVAAELERMGVNVLCPGDIYVNPQGCPLFDMWISSAQDMQYRDAFAAVLARREACAP